MFGVSPEILRLIVTIDRRSISNPLLLALVHLILIEAPISRGSLALKRPHILRGEPDN